MSGHPEDQRCHVRKIPSLTGFKGDSIDPESIHPFHFETQSQNGCRQGYDHLDILLQRRDISGRTKEFLRLIQSKYNAGSCTTVQGRDRTNLSREIKVLENMWESHREKVYGRNSDRKRLEALSQELKELKFYAIFGDYAAIFCKEIKNLGPAHAINKFEHWRDAEEVLQKEDQSVDEWHSDKSKKFPAMPLHDSIEDVATQLKPHAHPDMVRFWIRTYATRNETFHCGVHEALDANDWPKLASYILQYQKKKYLESSPTESSGPDSFGQPPPPLRLTPYSKKLERRQQQRRAASASIAAAESADETEAEAEAEA